MALKFKWTIWIIVQQDGQHLLEYDLMIRTILREVRLKGTGIRFIIYHYDQETKIASVKTIQLLEDGGLIFASDPSFTSKVVKFYENETLISFFKQYNKEKSLKNIVVTWGHGSGFGYFFSKETLQNKVDYFNGFEKEDFGIDMNALNNLLNMYTFIGSNMPTGEFGISSMFESSIQPENKGSSGEFKGISQVFEKYREVMEERLNFISAENFSLILKNGFSEKKIDILLTSCCYVQSLETCFFFRTAVKIVVAPQTSFPFLGYNYSSLISLLRRSPDIDINLIAENIVDEFKDLYSNQLYKTILNDYYQLSEPYPIKLVSFSAINLQNFDQSFFEILNSFGEIMYNEKMKEIDVPAVEVARFLCKDLTVFDESGLNILIDLTYFIQSYNNSKNDPKVNKIFESYKAKLKTKDLRISYLKAKYNVSNPRFLSFMMLPIGVPDQKKPILKLMIKEIYNNSTFKNELKNWSNFLIAWNFARL